MGVIQNLNITPGAAAAGFFGALVVWYIFATVRESRRLRAFKGPWVTSWTRIWLARVMLSGEQHLKMATELEKSGDKTIRVSPNDLLTTDTDLLRRMNAARSPYNRSDFFKAFKFNPESENLISELDDEKHTKLRAKMAWGYSGKENLTMEGDIDECVQGLINLIDRKYKSTPTSHVPVDFASAANFFTLDVITKLAFGKAFGYLSTDSDLYSWMATVASNFPFMQFLGAYPWLGAFMRNPRIMALLFPSDKDPVGVGRVLGVSKELVAERFGPDAKVRQDMLGSFIRHGLSQKRCESETLLQILAGSDTTAIAIRSTLLYLCTRPQTFFKLRSEIDAFEKDGKLSKPIVKESESKEMPYLQACIKEGLRLCPPITGPMSKEVPIGGDIIEGHFVPAGVRVGASMWLVGREKSIYGVDSEFFRPERWLEASPDALKAMEKQNDLFFGYGKFGCLGKNIAWVELNKIFIELLRRYDIAPIDVSKPWVVNDFGIQLHRKMYMRFVDRLDGKRPEGI